MKRKIKCIKRHTDDVGHSVRITFLAVLTKGALIASLKKFFFKKNHSHNFQCGALKVSIIFTTLFQAFTQPVAGGVHRLLICDMCQANNLFDTLSVAIPLIKHQENWNSQQTKNATKKNRKNKK